MIADTRTAGPACVLLACVLGVALADGPGDHDPLPSWNDGPTKKALTDFVHRVTTKGPDFVPVNERIAAFDNDGTLWVEQPIYTQLVFVFDRVKALGGKHPDWKEKPPFATVLSGDPAAMRGLNKRDLVGLLAATTAGISTDEYAKVAKDWLATAKHPRFKRLYTECVYQPQVELLAYLRGNGFKTFLVTGGGTDFVRGFAEPVYGVPPEQVVGTSGKTKFEMRDGQPILVKLPELVNIDDGPGKPVNIQMHIGRRPILTFGNSDGDLEMLQYTDAGTRPRLCLIVHHDDAEREYAYDRKSPIGRLDKALDEAEKRKWTVVSMKKDWKRIFPGK